MGFAVYLFVEVRAQPAEVAVAPRSASPSPPPPGPPPEVEPAHAPRVPHAPSFAAAPSSAANSAAADAERRGVHRAKINLPGRFDPIAPTPDAAGSGSDGDALGGPKLDTVMAEANRAYDRGDFDDAKQVAGRVLARDPSNVRMLRVMVSASCMDGDSAAAQQHFAKLPPTDQEQMRVRCARYGIAFAP